MFKKFLIIFLTLFMALLMSCEEAATSISEEEASEAIAEEVTELALSLGGQVMGGGVAAGIGAERDIYTYTGTISISNMTGAPEGLNCTGTYEYSYDTDTGIYDLDVTMTMTFDDVESDDGVWTMDGTLVATQDISMIITATGGITIDGSLTGTLSVTDGDDEYDFIFALDQTQVYDSASGDYSCTVSGTITSGTSVITIDETFSYSA